MTTKVLFVCMGNICRSPSAEGVFRAHVAQHGLSQQIEIASAGTENYHIGDSADPRSIKAALSRGIDISTHRAQQVQVIHFDEYDYILVMDTINYKALMRICPAQYEYKVHYFLEFAPHLDVKEVPDPYHGGAHGFEHVLDLIEAASEGLLQKITALSKSREELGKRTAPNS